MLFSGTSGNHEEPHETGRRAAYAGLDLPYRLNRLKPRAPRSKGASIKLWYAQSQWLVYDHLD